MTVAARADDYEMTALPDSDYAVTWAILGVYLCVLCTILAHTQLRARRSSPSGADGGGAVDEHYLASRGLPPVFLAMTTVASAFSGYTVTGLPAEAYSTGFGFLRWFGLNVPQVLLLITLSPRLVYLSKLRGYVSVFDVVRDRFVKGPIFPARDSDPAGSALHWLSTFTFLVPSAVYLLVQFIAFSSNMYTLAEGQVPQWVFGLVFFLLLAVFEIVGGLKAVVLTDVFQGFVLLFGAVAWLVISRPLFGSLEDATAKLAAQDPALVAPPSGYGLWNNWLNFMIFAGSRPVFPDVITRMCASGSQRPVRATALTFMGSLFLIFISMGLLGVYARAQFGDDLAPNSVFTTMCLQVVHTGWAGSIVGSLLIASSTAAIMSTADSVLMEVAKLVSLDVCQPLLRACGRPTDDAQTLRIGRVVTFAVAAGCWALTASEALTQEDLSAFLGFQSLFSMAMLPTFLVSLYSDSTPAWLAAFSIAFGLAGGICASTVGESTPILTSLVLLANLALVGAGTLAERLLRPSDEIWKGLSQAIAERDERERARDETARERQPLPRPSLARPSSSAPAREPVHSWPALVGVIAALPLVLPWGGADVESRTLGMPDWAVMFCLRVVAVTAVLLYLVLFRWTESPDDKSSQGAAGGADDNVTSETRDTDSRVTPGIGEQSASLVGSWAPSACI